MFTHQFAAVIATTCIVAVLTAETSLHGGTGLALVQRRASAVQKKPSIDGQQSMPVGSRLGNLIVPEPKNISRSGSVGRLPAEHEDLHAVSTNPIFPVAELKQNLTTSGCDNMGNDVRVALMLLDAPFHGSTAVTGVLMGSKNVATLCSAGDWQCEGLRIMSKHGYHWYGEWDWSRMLELYSQYWDLHRRILFDKSTGIQKEAALRTGIDDATLPRSMTRLGIKRLDRAYILVWRPICLSSLSSHASHKSSHDLGDKESNQLQDLVTRHRELLSQKKPVLTINLADLMWRPSRNQKRLSEFLPCLGELDLDYRPTLGVDVYPGNEWKADGSVVSFGKSVDPKGLNYDVENQKCLGATEFDSISAKARKSALESVEYLRGFS